MNWFDNAIMYHIYPLGFCGAPKHNEGGEPVNRLEKVLDWIPHLKECRWMRFTLGQSLNQ